MQGIVCRATDVGVLLRLAGLDVLDRDAPLLSPDHQLATGVFWAVLYPYRPGFAAPLDDPVQAANDPFNGQGKIHVDAQAFAIEVIQHVQQPQCPAIHCPAAHACIREKEVMFGASGTASASGLSRFNRLRGLIRRFSSNSQQMR